MPSIASPRYVITSRNPQEERTLTESDGIRIIAPLDRGQLVEADPNRLANLPPKDWRVKQLQNPNIINIFSYRIDVTQGQEPDLPEAFGATDGVEADERQNYIVHFIGPIQESWLTVVSERGVRLIEPISPFTYLVRAAPEAIADLTGLPFVSWTGEFKPGYKVNPVLMDAGLMEANTEDTGAATGLGAITAIDIGVLADGDLDDVVVRIQALGGTVIAISPPSADIYRSVTAEILPPGRLAQLATHGDVRWIDIVREPVLEDERSNQIAYEDLDGVAAPGTSAVPGYAGNLAGLGIDGDGVTVAVCDTGIDTNVAATMHADLAGRLAFAVDASGAALAGPDTDGHGTHVAGIVAGNGASGDTDPQGFLLGQGMAPAARVGSLLAGGTRQQRVQTAAQQGAQIMNNSYALDGANYGAGDRTFDLGVRDADATSTNMEPLAIVFSAGNSGPAATSCTKAMKNALVIGNSLNARPGEGDIDDIRGLRQSSSRGPAGDGRTLPHFVAPGTDIVNTRGVSGWRGGPYTDTSGTIHTNHTQMSGTSMAAPAVAGTCALLIDWWRQTRGGATPSPALLKALLAVSTESMVGGPDRNGGTIADEPNNDTGWGRISLENTLLQTPESNRGPKLFVDQRQAFTATGQEYRIRIAAATAGLPLRIAVAWTDAAGAVGANPALVNDLDLEVLEVYTGTVFRGNVFNNGFSVAGGAADALNNLECAFIQNPSGMYEVTIIAGNIMASARPDVVGPWQDFGLVIDNGEVPAADPVSVVAVLDRSGSMQSYGYVDVTRQASRQFIDLMSVDDSVGVVSFGSTGRQEYPVSGGPALITSSGIRTAAITAVDNISFGGCTFMGDGIQQAGGMLSGAGSRRALVMLSDGYDNKGCDSSNPLKLSALDAAASLPADLPIYSCAMGESADQALLSQLADNTGGRYYFMPTIDDLFEIYNFIRGQVTGEGVIVNESSMASRSTVSGFVDACASSLTFTVAWHDESLRYVAHDPKKPEEISVRLRSPGGRWFPHSATELARTIGKGYLSLHLQDPQPGHWTVEVTTAREAHTPYTVGGFVRSDIDLHLQAPARVIVGQPVNLKLAVHDGKGIVEGLRVAATVSSPRYHVDDLLLKYADQLASIKLPDGLRKEGDRRQQALARLVLLRNELRGSNKPDLFARGLDKLPMGSVSTSNSPTVDPKKWLRGTLTSAMGSGIASTAAGIPGGQLHDWRKVLRPQQRSAITGTFGGTKVPGSYSFVTKASGFSPQCGTRFVRLGMISTVVQASVDKPSPFRPALN